MSEFDHVVHHRDPKNGRVVRENPYSKICKQVPGSDASEEIYERPPLSGIFYKADGSLIEDKSKAGLAKLEAVEKAKAEKQRLENLSPEEKKKLEVEKAIKFLQEQGIQIPIKESK